jgi:molybdenum cofactor synthesis domain-containing protein
MIKAAILTVSDSCSRGERKDVSGQTIGDVLGKQGFEVCERKIVADDRDAIAGELRRLADSAGVDLVFTTGGTGLGPRDVTPEATQLVCERMVPGISEMIRAQGRSKTKNSVLSRGVAGIRNKTLIINLPGSPKGARESLEIILDVLPHAVEMMHGGGH